MKHRAINPGARGLILALSLVATAAFAQNSAKTAQDADATIHTAMATQATATSQLAMSPLLARDQAVQAWRRAMKLALPSQTGCFTSSYPSTQWQQVPCTPPQNLILPNPPRTGNLPLAPTPPGQETIIGSGYDYVATTTPGNPISSTEGSFFNVSGITNMSDSIYGTNYFSLQINSNYGIPLGNYSSYCSSFTDWGGCSGWVQFVYQNYGNGPGYLAIWYMLLDASSCPPSWTNASMSYIPDGAGVCYYSLGESISPQGIFDLGNMDFHDQTVSGKDALIFSVAENIYVTSNSSVFEGFSQAWSQAEFNVFGTGGGSTVNFNNGSTLAVKTNIDNGTANAPACNNNGTTGETSNLYFNSSCCAYAGGEPSIAFVEGTSASTTTTCASLGDNTITPSAGPNGTITPSTAVHVPNGAASTFVVTPNTGYNVSVTGCNGSFSNVTSTYTTGPITTNCTITATFTSTSAQSMTPQAITGDWYDPTYNGSGFNITMTGAGLILYYYGWDSTDNRLWLVSDIGPMSIVAGTSVTLNMNETSGGHFLTPANPSTSSNWGTLTLNFSANGATATAALTGKDGTVALNLQKIVGMTSTASVTGDWYDPAYNGSGFNMLMTGVGLSLYYYGWDSSGNRLWLLSDIGPTTITPGSTITLNMNETSGGHFLTPANPTNTLSVWGTLKLDFSANCSTATATLAGKDGTANLNVQMIVGVLNLPPGC